MIQENLAHGMRGESEEVRAILPLGLLPAGHPHIGLVNQSGGLESMAGPLALHFGTGHAP
jgi:hypothetical protein